MAKQNAVSPAGKTGGLTVRGVVSVVILAALVVFVLQNTTGVPIHFLGLYVTLPVWLLIVAAFVLGMLLDGLVRGAIRKSRGKDGA